jgi:hypothetical protein
MFFRENASDMITQNISYFFGDLLLSHIPHDFIDNLIVAEVAYYHLKGDDILDGFSIISSYHKALDSLVEDFVVKEFRSFVMKHGIPKKAVNHVVEKFLDRVVQK